VFDFELEETSAGAALTNAPDAVQPGLVTCEVRKLIEQSGRYRPVDVSHADAEGTAPQSKYRKQPHAK